MSGRNTYSGSFVPKNLSKYRGDPRKITYRSSWEHYMMKWLDANSLVAFWNSEETVIPYYSTADKKHRRYFMDFKVWFTTGQVFLFEVKPYKETQPPVAPKRFTKKSKERFINELYTYQVNQDKWKATKALEEKSKNFIFRVITEHTLRNSFGWKG